MGSVFVKVCFVGWLFCCLCTLSSCQKEDKTTYGVKTDSAKIDDKVLVKVNNGNITEYDLELAARRMLGAGYEGKFDEAAKKNLLNSLVAAKAIAQKADAGLTEQEKYEIKKKVDAFRDELLVKTYLQKHISPEPISEKEIKEYYDSHLDQFGKKTTREYEMIMSANKLGPNQRARLLDALGDPGLQKNWKQWVAQLLKKGYPVQFNKGSLQADKLDKQLSLLISSLEQGQESSPAFIKGRLFIVKVVKVTEIPPRPLNDVRMQIRRTLSPIAVKKALEKAKERVLKDAKISYMEKKND